MSVMTDYTGRDFTQESMSSAVGYYSGSGSPGWYALAACANKPMHWFFGHDEDSQRPKLNIAELERARKVCFSCPVQEECLSWALEHHEEFGVWGGTTGRDRAKWWRKQGIVVGNDTDI